MLILPEHYRVFNWLGIDPGLTNCGVASFTATPQRIESLDATTIQNHRIGFCPELSDNVHTERITRLNALGLVIRAILQEQRPSLVCCESPFYNPRMPGAYGSLVETITMIRMEIHRYHPGVPFLLYSPQEVKQSFKRSGQIGKLVMREALETLHELREHIRTPLEYLDEHAIDAIAVGYTGWLHQLKPRSL